MISMYVLAVAACFLILALFRAELSKAGLARKTWNELIDELRPVNTDGITLAALECSDVGGFRSGFEREEAWTMIGGWEGLNRMQANAQLLIALAGLASAWNSGSSLAAVEQMRSDARSIHRVVRRIKFGRFLGQGTRLSPDAVGPACAYYRMSECLLALYERSPSRRYEQLTAAVWPHPILL